jgi:hypothetical protein
MPQHGDSLQARVAAQVARINQAKADKEAASRVLEKKRAQNATRRANQRRELLNLERRLARAVQELAREAVEILSSNQVPPDITFRMTVLGQPKSWLVTRPSRDVSCDAWVIAAISGGAATYHHRQMVVNPRASAYADQTVKVSTRKATLVVADADGNTASTQDTPPVAYEDFPAGATIPFNLAEWPYLQYLFKRPNLGVTYEKRISCLAPLTLANARAWALEAINGTSQLAHFKFLEPADLAPAAEINENDFAVSEALLKERWSAHFTNVVAHRIAG